MKTEINRKARGQYAPIVDGVELRTATTHKGAEQVADLVSRTNYSDDNGRIACYAHLGSTARHAIAADPIVVEWRTEVGTFDRLKNAEVIAFRSACGLDLVSPVCETCRESWSPVVVEKTELEARAYAVGSWIKAYEARAEEVGYRPSINSTRSDYLGTLYRSLKAEGPSRLVFVVTNPAHMADLLAIRSTLEAAA